MEQYCIDTQPDPEFAEERRKRKNAVRLIATKSTHVSRRATSENELFKLLPSKLSDDESLHVISGGNIDTLSFLRYALLNGPADHVVISSWVVNGLDIEELHKLVSAGSIKRLDVYVGDYFIKRRAGVYPRLCEIIRTNPAGGRVCIFNNHSKVVVVACHARNYYAVIESSANLQTNPRTEQTVVTRSRPLAEFYRDFYDGVRSHQRNFDNWTPHGWPSA